MAIILALQNGLYSATSTWTGGVIPTTGDIACSGPYRITIDQDVLATISNTNLDWVAGGGATLTTTNTGGFTVVDGATISIYSLRYGLYRLMTSTSTNSTLVINGGNITVGDCFFVESPATNSTATIVTVWANPTLTNLNLTLNFGNITLYTGTTQIGSPTTFISTAPIVNSNITISVGSISLISAYSTHTASALTVSGSSPYSEQYTFNGDIYNGAKIYIASALATTTSSVNFKTKYLNRGSGTRSANISLSNFKTITF